MHGLLKFQIIACHVCASYNMHTESTSGGVLTVRKLGRLHKLSSKWYYLGIQLKLKLKQLDEIEKKHQSDEYKCMIKMFELWLTEYKASYSRLLKALKSIGESEENVASYKDILSQQSKLYRSIGLLHISVLNSSIAHHIEICQ